MNYLKVKKLYVDALLPIRSNPTDSGADVFAHSVKKLFSSYKEKALTFPLVLEKGERVLIGTGLAATVGTGFEIQVRSRSGIALKQGIIVANSPGTVDETYRGEIGVIMINSSLESQIINRNEKIAQLVVAPVECCKIVEVEELDKTIRGDGGFGSTGI